MLIFDRRNVGSNDFRTVMNQIEGFILAGGASSRMGVDKAQLLIGQESLTQHIANKLFALTSSITVVGNKVNDQRIKFAKDVYPGWGALGGVQAALYTCVAEWAVVLACDLPFISSELLIRLAELRKNYEAVVPIQPDGRPQPLCALYRVDPCLDRATELIEMGKRRPLDLLERVNTRWVPYDEVKDLNQAQNFFVNINTPEDYYDATQKAATQAN